MGIGELTASEHLEEVACICILITLCHGQSFKVHVLGMILLTVPIDLYNGLDTVLHEVRRLVVVDIYEVFAFFGQEKAALK